jgi:polar amino acid transport system permease protein
LAVLLPSASRIAQTAAAERIAGAFRLRLRPAHGVALLALFILGCGLAQAQVQPGQPSILATLWKWTPVLLRGFVFNLVISAVAMAAGTIVGLFLGFAQISLLLPVRKGAWLTTHFFRNAPWLVLLFYCMFLLPFQVTIFGVTIPIPDWIKATLGLSLPVMANVSEIVRGAIQSIPTAQVGIRRVARLQSPADAVDDHLPPMHQAHAAAVDEPVRDPHDGDRVDVDRRRQ